MGLGKTDLTDQGANITDFCHNNFMIPSIDKKTNKKNGGVCAVLASKISVLASNSYLSHIIKSRPPSRNDNK